MVDDHAAGVRELLRRLVPRELEAGGGGHPADAGLVAGEEVPALLGARPLVGVEVDRLLGRRHHRGLARVEADGDDVELLAGGLLEHAQPAHQPVEDLGAEHRALVVDEGQHHRPGAEVLAQPHLAPGLVAEGGVERQLGVELLVESHLLQRRSASGWPAGQRRRPQARRGRLRRVPTPRPSGPGRRRGAAGVEAVAWSRGRCASAAADVRPADASWTTIVVATRGGCPRAPAARAAASAPSPARSGCGRRRWPCRPSRSCSARRAGRSSSSKTSLKGWVCSRGAGGACGTADGQREGRTVSSMRDRPPLEQPEGAVDDRPRDQHRRRRARWRSCRPPPARCRCARRPPRLASVRIRDLRRSTYRLCVLRAFVSSPVPSPWSPAA